MPKQGSDPCSPTARGARRARPRGQAMVEYSVVTWVLVMALVLMGSAPVFRTTLPGSTLPGGNRNVLEMMLEAAQLYFDSIYVVLSLPV